MAESNSNERKEVKYEQNPKYFRNQRGNRYSHNNYQKNFNSDQKMPLNSRREIEDKASENYPELVDKTRFQNHNNYHSQFNNTHIDNFDSSVSNSVLENVPSNLLSDTASSRRTDYYEPQVDVSNTRAYYNERLDKKSGNSYNPNSRRSDHKQKYRNVQDRSSSARQNMNGNCSNNIPSEYQSQKSKINANPLKKHNSRNSSSQNASEQYEQELNHETVSGSNQRGKIVGGRYIRKLTSNSVLHSKSFSSEINDRDIDNSHYSSKPYKEQNPRKDYQRKTYYDLDYRRDYAYENANNCGGGYNRKIQNNPRKLENISSPTDVYHYSTNIDEKRIEPNVSSANKKNYSSKLSRFKEDDANQREILIQHLNKGDCECLVCCEQIRTKDQIWHCLSCYHVFHLRCIRKWARSPAAVVEDGGWRCPACQSLTNKVPYDYFCFCGKSKNPDINYHITAHSCGEICNRKRSDCSHLCKELCHPGPCPPCLMVVQKSCACGKTFKMTTCKQSIEETCVSVCDKLLNCGIHSCKSLCHSGECFPCEVVVSQDCFCSKSSRSITCTPETSTMKFFSCGEICEKLLNCGHHKCKSICHSGACDLCNLSIQVVKTCPCGKSTIEELVASGQAIIRKSCEDPIPVCNEICNKTLICGPKDNPHKCQSSCHTGDCPPCPLTTSKKCRCGAFTKEFDCGEVKPAFEYTCEKRCNKRKDCGRHKCLNKCCIAFEHKCELICNKKLSCGNHQCQENCHAGNCPTCWNVSFDELRCHCGESVLYPPIHCGVKPPECSKPCIRIHSCDHEVKHTCHSDESCPPCTSLTVKWCYGHHKQCGSVMCFLDGVSCGMLCQKPLSCGRHECQLTCHPGPCLKPGEKCTQVCTTPRTICGHPCGNPCHDGPCVDTPCRAKVTLSCPCGHRSENTTCYDSTKTYRLMSVSVLASKMQEIKDGQSVNLNDVLGRKSKNSKLQCNEECAIIERNKRLAVALQIQNPDLSCSPGPPSYSEFLKTEAKKNPTFVSDVYSKISDLVQLAKESKQKCRSHSFPPMNRDQRKVIHELAEFFGCETQSYDEEPKKNVVVTAHKTKCWLPFVSIMTVVQRDMGFRKGPAPVLIQRDSKNSSGASNTTNNQKKKIDYFDYKE